MSRFIPSAPALTRRTVLAGLSSLALAGGAQAQQAIEIIDVAIIGGGAAGVAAARKLAAAGRSYVVLEAGPVVGGRARSTSAFGQTLDLGASSFARGTGTLAAAIEEADLPLAALPGGIRLYADGREAPERGYDAFAQTLGRARRDLLAGADTGRDGPAGPLLAANRTPWSGTVEALLGPLGCGRGLAQVSTLDLARRSVAPDDVTSPLGLGTMFTRLSAWLNVKTGTEVTGVTNAGRFYALTMKDQKTPLRARVVVLAVPAPVLASGAIRFNPALPPRLVAALRGCPSGAMEEVAFVLPGNPLGLADNERVMAKVESGAPALLRGRIHGSDVHVLRFGGKEALALSQKGAAAGRELARAFLAANFPGLSVLPEEVTVSNWTGDPFSRGAMAVAMPGQGAQRRVFADPLGRMVLAGEYTSPDNWGTLTGAWDSGEIAAERALRLIGGGPA